VAERRHDDAARLQQPAEEIRTRPLRGPTVSPAMTPTGITTARVCRICITFVTFVTFAIFAIGASGAVFFFKSVVFVPDFVPVFVPVFVSVCIQRPTDTNAGRRRAEPKVFKVGRLGEIVSVYLMEGRLQTAERVG
jgi:hypothetical protein